MNQDQLDFICKNVRPTSDFEWFLLPFEGQWLGGKVRSGVTRSIELWGLQVIPRKDLQDWKDYEAAKQMGRNSKKEQGKGRKVKEGTRTS